MTATCTPHSACVAQTAQATRPSLAAQLSLPVRAATWWTARLRRYTHWIAHFFAWRATTASKPFAREDSQWQSAIKSLEDLDETTLKDIGAPSWVVSEIERNRQSALRRTLRIPHI